VPLEVWSSNTEQAISWDRNGTGYLATNPNPVYIKGRRFN
jgi:hypothetical protein